ncbi:hypothetical protein V8C44DRAFT_307486 [Trichoderma aethiopicum]
MVFFFFLFIIHFFRAKVAPIAPPAVSSSRCRARLLSRYQHALPQPLFALENLRTLCHRRQNVLQVVLQMQRTPPDASSYAAYPATQPEYRLQKTQIEHVLLDHVLLVPVLEPIRDTARQSTAGLPPDRA